jgi:succinate dehydrogenase / fumarate reductase iron-sulfur subunit
MSKRTLHIWRGGTAGGDLVAYEIEAETGMVVLDAVLEIQRSQANDLAVRWNCKAAKCGSCSAEINGLPRLMCKTRLDHLPEEEPLTVEPLKAFPVIRDLVTDVSWNYEVNKRIPPFTPKPDTGVGDRAGGRRPGRRVPEVHRVLPLPGRVPHPA